MGVGWEVMCSRAQVKVEVGAGGEGASSIAPGRKVARMGRSASRLSIGGRSS